MGSQIFVDFLRLLGVAILVAANGFFVAAEFAVVNLRRTRVEELIHQGKIGATAIKKAQADLNRFLAAAQLGITLASLGLGWLGEPALAHLIQPLLDLLPAAWVGAVSHSISAAIVFAFITFLHVVVGEQAPKSVALQKTEQIALAVAPPMLLTENLFKPAIWVLNSATSFLLRLAGLPATSGHPAAHSVEELKMLVEVSEEHGVLEDSEKEMLHAVFDFRGLTAHEVMVPRTELIGINAEAPVEELMQLSTQHMLSQFPVYEGDIDHILGLVHVRDLVRPEVQRQRTAKRVTSVRGLMREILFVPASIRLDVLLQEFRAKHQHFAIALDEYGGTAGLVTLADVMAKIVGEVRDAFDKSAPQVQRLPDGSTLVDGLMQIEEVNEQFGLQLHDDNYDTIAGFVLGQLGRMAAMGDTVEAGGVKLRVEALDGKRIARLLLFKPEVNNPPSKV